MFPMAPLPPTWSLCYRQYNNNGLDASDDLGLLVLLILVVGGSSTSGPTETIHPKHDAADIGSIRVLGSDAEYDSLFYPGQYVPFI